MRGSEASRVLDVLSRAFRVRSDVDPLEVLETLASVLREEREQDVATAPLAKSSAERTREYRERTRLARESVTSHVTPRDAACDVKGDDAQTEANGGAQGGSGPEEGEKNEKERGNPESDLSGNGASEGETVTPCDVTRDAICDVTPSQRKRRRRTEKPEVPFPVDFKPTDSHRAFALAHGLDLDLEVYSLKGWAEGRLAVSWNGVLSTRLANSVKWRKERGGAPVRGGRPPVQPSHGVNPWKES